MFSSLCCHWKHLLEGKPPCAWSPTLSCAPKPWMCISDASGSQDGARSGQRRQSSSCDVPAGAEDAPHSPQTLPGASHCQHCVQDHLTQELSLVVAVRGRENKDAALPSALQPVFFLILGEFCVFGDIGGVLMPLPLPDPCVVPLGVSPS